MSAKKQKQPGQQAHDHAHGQGEETFEKNLEEQLELARDLGKEAGEIFQRLMRGEIDFAETSFAIYDVLQDAYIVSTGNYEIAAGDDEEWDDEEWDEDEGANDGYDEAEHTRQQEDLSGEPAR